MLSWSASLIRTLLPLTRRSFGTGRQHAALSGRCQAGCPFIRLQTTAMMCSSAPQVGGASPAGRSMEVNRSMTMLTHVFPVLYRFYEARC